jgi:cysteine-rich repeat protein
MRSMMMRYILIILWFLMYQSAFAYPAEVACNPWENISWNVCTQCFNDRFYVWDNFDYWDKFYTEGRNTLFSSSQSSTIFDLDSSYITHSWVNDDRIVSTYMPWSINNGIIFANYNFQVVWQPASRNDIVWRIGYDLYFTEEVSSWTPLNANWNYTDYIETTDVNWNVNIVYNLVDLGTSTKYINTSNKIHHTQCYNLRVSFCWDGVIDIWNETCEDWNLIDWDGCSSTCQTEVPPVVPPVIPPGGGWGGWGSVWGSGWGAWTWICWDGNVQRPNSNFFLEECDFWSESDWSFCNADCTYSNTTFPVSWIWEITIPNGWSLNFWPIDSVIIWEWMNPYIAHSLWKPYLKNNSDYDFYFDQLCVIEKSWTTLLGSSICENTPNILKAWETIYFNNTPNFIWSAITTWNYSDNRLITTIKHNWVRYDDAYFTGPLDVRVAKSSIATTWGWTSYLSDGSSISNISDIAGWIVDVNKNKNFVWVWVSWGDSSYSNDITDAWSVATVQWEWDIYSDSLNQVSDNIWTTSLINTLLLTEFENYNWISNVFILRNKNFVIDSDILAWLSWARTYVIENWDLLINSNISYSDNIAFVVKWWNIKIDKSVWSIDWTYISITKDWIGWSFLWAWGKTTDILLINWSLYWNINSLISTRTYVKQNSTGQIDVWTIVSFGSSLFRRSAPLLSTFINEYLQSEKIAK